MIILVILLITYVLRKILFFLFHFFLWEDFRYFNLPNSPFTSCCCNTKTIFEKNVIIFFKIKNNTNEKELKDSYDLIPSQKGNILLIKNSLVGLLISIIGNEKDEKAFIFL